MADLVNEFSWSRTRDGVFKECRRRYYLHYYGSWGGWDAESDPRVRRLYVLKQLGTRQMWAGRLVHEAIERALLTLRDGFALSEASLIDNTVRQMRGEWKGSRAAIYHQIPKRAGLFEHEYAVPIKDTEWQALRDHVIRCLRNFHRLPLLASIKATPTDRWVLIEDIRTFTFEDTTIYAAPDFGFWQGEPQPQARRADTRVGEPQPQARRADTEDPPERSEGGLSRLTLVDWKTGGSGSDASLQLAGYALYALETLGVDPSRTELLEVNLREGKVTSHPCDGAAIERVREHIRLSVRSMKAYLRDAARNLGVEDDFERTEDRRICRWCNFRAVCRPELPPFVSAEAEVEPSAEPTA